MKGYFLKEMVVTFFAGFILGAAVGLAVATLILTGN